APAAPPDTGVALRPPAPLIARLREMTQLDRALDLAVRGSGAACLLSGEEGCGKTRLLHEFAAANAFRTCLFLDTAFPPDLSLPFGGFRPLIVAAFDRLDALARDVAVRLLQRYGPDLGKFAVGLRERLAAAGLSPILDAPTNRGVETIFQFLLDLAAWRPLVLGFDRLELADRYSAELFRALAAAAKGRPLFLLGAVGAGKPTEGNPFPRMLPELRREGLVADLVLPPFSRLDVEAFFRSRLRWEKPAPALISEIHRLTGGNPSKVERILGYLLEKKLVAQEGGEWRVSGAAGADLDLALGLSDTLIPKYKSLGRKHQTVLQAAAINGRAASFKVLKEITGLTETELYYLLNDLVSERMLVERPEKGQSSYAVMTPALGDHVLGQLPKEERAKVHDRVARSLEKMLGELPEDTADAIADHFLETTAADKAAEYCIKAGERLARGGQAGRALERFDQALALAPRLRNHDLQADALERAALANARQGRIDLGLRQLNESSAAAVRKADRAYPFNRGLGLIHLLADRFIEAGRHFDLAAAAMPRAAKKDEVELLLPLARLAFAKEEYPKALELFKLVEQRAAAPGREDAQAGARLGQAQVAFAAGEAAKASAAARGALEAVDKREQLETRGEALVLLGRLALLKYEREEAQARFGAAQEAARAMPDPGLECKAVIGQGTLAARSGQPGRARDLLSAALDLARKADRVSLLGQAHLALGALFLATEEIVPAMENGTEALMHCERIGVRSGIAAAGALLGRAHLVRGALDKAGPLLTSAAATFEKIGARAGLAAAQAALADYHLRRDELPAVEATLAKALENAQRYDDVRVVAQVHRLQALMLAKKKELKQANSWFVKCLQALEKSKDAWAQAEASLRYAQFLLDTNPAAGTPPQQLALKHARLAADAFAALGLPAWKKRADAEIARALK
ncbi:MAG: AAA family ATPase, partial [Planctomycetes bacterium]|nr:AAA family ATPase [Planctomycetota bacterium]